MNCNYKGCFTNDKSSKKYKVLKVIMKEYGSLSRFLDDIKLEVRL